MELEAIIKKIEATKVVGTNGFEMRDLHVTTEEQHPQVLAIQFIQGKVTELDNFAIGDKVKIKINLRGREWVNPQGETVVFNTIQGWKIDKIV
jgi:hypothetical protein